MILWPFSFDPELSEKDYQKIGYLSLSWAALEHVIGNCLKAMLDISDDEAIVMVFPLGLEQRMQKMNALVAVNKYDSKVAPALAELTEIMKAIQYVRNNVIHAIVLEDDVLGHVFHLQSKQRTLTKTDVFSTEELTNYAAHVARRLRFALGLGGKVHDYTLPDRPAIPEFLRELIPTRKK